MGNSSSTQLQRQQQLHLWLKQQLNLESDEFDVVSGDASFRRYFRLKHSTGTVVGVDAPPEHENNRAFVAIARGLLKAGLNVPEILAVDFEQGFLALSDLGDQQLLPELNSKTVDDWYQQAMHQLLLIQKTSQFSDYELPRYDRQRLMDEMQLMPEWFVQKHLQIELSDSDSEQLQLLFQRLATLALSQPQVTVHRDFHSRNLMVTVEEQLAVIDFQDAVTGAISYDLVSLIKDCYIQWPRSRVEQWIRDFHKMLSDNKTPGLPAVEEFIFMADAMAMQRHIKVLGIFSRLNYRDGKVNYLQDLPLTLDYIIETAESYKEFEWFANLLRNKIVPTFKRRQQPLETTT